MLFITLIALVNSSEDLFKTNIEESLDLKSKIEDVQINDLYPATTSVYNEEKVKLWINTKTERIRNYETCTVECESFCGKISGDHKICNEKCTAKFCGVPTSGSYYLTGTLVGVTVLACGFLAFSAKAYKKSKNIEQTDVDYARI